MGDLKRLAVHEQWRRYNWGERIYQIDRPIWVWYREGGSTHRVVDQDGIVHIVPGPGYRGCVITYKPLPDADEVHA